VWNWDTIESNWVSADEKEKGKSFGCRRYGVEC